MNIYHYTKGVSLPHILASGWLKTEREAGFNRVQKMTNFVWLTAKEVFPKTALPFVSALPATDLHMQAVNKGKMAIDMEALAEICGGLYRFGFDSSDKRFSQWRGSNERRFMLRKKQWVAMEAMANAVGDDISKFWFARKHVELRNFCLEKYKAGTWNLLVHVDNSGALLACNEAEWEASAEEAAVACARAGLPPPARVLRAA